MISYKDYMYKWSIIYDAVWAYMLDFISSMEIDYWLKMVTCLQWWIQGKGHWGYDPPPLRQDEGDFQGAL